MCHPASSPTTEATLIALLETSAGALLTARVLAEICGWVEVMRDGARDPRQVRTDGAPRAQAYTRYQARFGPPRSSLSAWNIRITLAWNIRITLAWLTGGFATGQPSSASSSASMPAVLAPVQHPPSGDSRTRGPDTGRSPATPGT